MRTTCWLLAGLIGTAALSPVHADEGDGLSLSLPRVQGRVRLGMGVEAAGLGLSAGSGELARLSGASVLGDYYFGRYSARVGEASGFRATTGVFLGSRLGMWGGHTSAVLSGSLLSVERQSFSLVPLPRGSEVTGQDGGTVPYLGLGYSGTSIKGGWGFSADLGLMALNPGSVTGLGRVFSGGQNMDDLLRELRLAPVLQVGVSYSF